MTTGPRIGIVGAGPAGSATALNLVRRGVDPGDIVVYDRARFPRPKLCGGGIPWRGTIELSDLLGAQPAGGGICHGLEFRSVLGRMTVREPGPQWLYDRAWLDNQLLAAVRATGVTVREEATVTALEPARDGWRLHLGSTVVAHRWIVGADGAGGLTRRAAALPGGWLGRLVEGVYEVADAQPDPSVLVFDFAALEAGIPGYAWIFPYPLPDGRLLWKLGAMDGRGVVGGQVLRSFVSQYAARHGFRPVDERLHGWPERYFSRQSRGHRPGLLLVGEAFGIDPLLGEGIAPSLKHAAYAAGRLRQALDDGRDVVGGYESEFLRHEEGWNLWFHEVLAGRLYGANPWRWLRFLFASPGLQRLARAETAAYGRLARHWAPLSGIFLRDVLRHRGLPSPVAPVATPLTPSPFTQGRIP